MEMIISIYILVFMAGIGWTWVVNRAMEDKGAATLTPRQSLLCTAGGWVILFPLTIGYLIFRYIKYLIKNER